MTRPTFHVIQWHDAYPHAVNVRVEGGKITGVKPDYARWRGRNLRELLTHLAGYSWWVRVNPG